MSLSSRLSSLFFQDTSNENSQRNGYAQPDLDLELDGARQNKRPRTMEKLAEEDIDVELERPPYYQVSAVCSVFNKLVLIHV